MSQRVTDRVIEEIRARTDIVELIGARVPLKRAAGSFKACCPFHKEKTPSFHVNPARQTTIASVAPHTAMCSSF